MLERLLEHEFPGRDELRAQRDDAPARLSVPRPNAQLLIGQVSWPPR